MVDVTAGADHSHGTAFYRQLACEGGRQRHRAARLDHKFELAKGQLHGVEHLVVDRVVQEADNCVGALDGVEQLLTRERTVVRRQPHVAVLGETGLMGDGWKHITHTELGVRRGDAAIAAAYQSADFFVNPSTNDNGPMMVGEALVCGVPVVAYPVGLPSVPWAEGMVGRVVEPVGDVPALAAAIRAFAEMPAAELAAKKRAAAAAAIAAQIPGPRHRRTHQAAGGAGGDAIPAGAPGVHGRSRRHGGIR